MVTMGILFISQLEQLQAVNMQNYMLLISFILSSLILLLIVTYDISGHFFRTKDFEIVASLPITSLEVVISKFLNFNICLFISIGYTTSCVSYWH